MDEEIIRVSIEGAKKAQAAVDGLHERLRQLTLALEEWKKTNPDYTTNEARFLEIRELNAELKEANAELKEANAELKEARSFYLQLLNTRQTNQRHDDASEETRNAINVPTKAVQDQFNVLFQNAKKPRIEYARDTNAFSNIPSQNKYTRLVQKIFDFDDSTIFDLGTYTTVPFPSLFYKHDRFQLNTERYFQYQARSDLQPLYDEVIDLWKEQIPVTVNVVGTIGYGKSHILAVLALLLLKNRNSFGETRDGVSKSPIILYIPDCQVIKHEHKFLTIMRQNVFINFPAYEGPLKTADDFSNVLRDSSVILIIDQFYSIDNQDDVCLKAQSKLSEYLGTSTVVEIHGMSMNSTAWKETTMNVKSHIDNIYCGGFTDQEFDAWMCRHADNALFNEHKDELISLSGKTPFFLSLFERCYEDGDSWSSLVQRVIQDKSVCNLQDCLVQFYAEKDASKIKNVYLALLSSRRMPSIQTDIDHRFFYQDKDGFICSIGEIVTRLLFQVWKKNVADDQILGIWTEKLKLSPNRSTRGFFVEEVIKAKVCQDGVYKKYVKDENCSISREYFVPGLESRDLASALKDLTNESWILMDPEIFNYAGVDMIL